MNLYSRIINQQSLHRICVSSLLISLLCIGGCAKLSIKSNNPPTWWKGNLHAHSYRSDGDTFPELVADWYKRHGYHFLSVTDHITVGNYDAVTTTSLLMNPARAASSTLIDCNMRFGKDWIKYAEVNGKKHIVLKSLDEYRGALEQPGRFLLLSGDEISGTGGWFVPVHVNAINITDPIRAAASNTIPEALNQILKNIDAQRHESGETILAQVNHPNFGWALTAEDIAPLEGAQMLEIFNGIFLCNNRGNKDGTRPSNERIWDIVLTKRLAELGKGPIFGIATDDAHNYHEFNRDRHNPGRGWMMVRAPELTKEAILSAIDKGDFYASTGVQLRDIQFSGKRIRIDIEPRQGITFKTQFIGTRKGYDPKSEEAQLLDDKGKPVRTTRRYSNDIGKVLAEVEGLNPSYTFKGDEIYVRACVISSDLTENPIYSDDYKTAWTQPFLRK